MDLVKEHEDMLSLYQEIEAVALRLNSGQKRQRIPPERQPYSVRPAAQGQTSYQKWKLMNELKRTTTLPPIQEEEGFANVDHHRRGDRVKRTAEIDYALLTAFLDYDDSFFSPWNWTARNPSDGGVSEFRYGSSKTASFLDYNSLALLPWK